MATLLMRPADGGSAEKKRRSRKAKNTQKKLPQRGLGVAQLEKLRLQEQSLLCPQPSYALRLCSPSDHPMARCESDMAQTILSLTNAHSVGCTVVRGGEASAVSRMTLNGHSTAQTLSPSVVQDRNSSNVESVDTKRSFALPCVGQQSPKLLSCNTSFFSNVLATTQLHIFDAHTQPGQRVDERRSSEAGQASTYIFPITSNVKEAANHVNEGGFMFHPVFKSHVQRIPFNVSDTPCLETMIGPDVPLLPRKRIELPVVSGRKRPWLALQDPPRQATQGQALDLNAPDVGNDVVGYNCNDQHSPRQHDIPENRAGAHYTTGIVRSALGNSSCIPLTKTKSASSSMSPWQDSCDSFSVSNYFPDVGGMYTGNGIVVRQCSVKERCPSASESSTCFTLNRKRCPNDTKISSFFGKESINSNFLTLGISSSSYPSSQSWNETEDNNLDYSPVSSNDVGRVKHSPTDGCEGDGHDLRVITMTDPQKFPGPKVFQLLSIAIDTRRRTRLCISYHSDLALSRTMANAVMHFVR